MQHILSLITSDKSIQEKDIDAYLKEPFQKKFREEVDKLLMQIVLHQNSIYQFPVANVGDKEAMDSAYYKSYLSGHLVFGIQYKNEDYVDEFRPIEHFGDVIIGFINNSTHTTNISLTTDKSKIEFSRIDIPPKSYKSIFNGRILPYSIMPYENIMWSSPFECDITVVYGILRHETRTKLFDYIVMYEELLENNQQKPDIVIKSGYMHNGKYMKTRFDGSQRDVVYL